MIANPVSDTPAAPGALRAIVSAYAVHPLANSAEGIVNALLLDALRTQLPLALVTSAAGYQPLCRPTGADQGVRVYAGVPHPSAARITTRLADWTTMPKRHIKGAAARLVDRIRVGLCGLPPLHAAAWNTYGSKRILELLDGDFRDAVVWARATPLQSFVAALMAFRRRPFALVANYNDPLPRCLLYGKATSQASRAQDALEQRINRLLAQHAQAWTFPSQRLADLMISAAGLDRRRCFVIPHLAAVPPATDTTAVDGGPWLIYTGTFYVSAFSEAVIEGLARYCREGRLRPLLVLKRPQSRVLEQIRRVLPDAQVLVDQSPAEVAALTRHASAILVVDSPAFRALLLTKVVQAIQAGKPILALASPCSTTGEVVAAIGGIVVSPTDAQVVCEGLRHLERRALDGPHTITAAQQGVIARFAPERIVQDSLAVLDYARRRFAWTTRRAGAEPQPPALERWP